MICVFFYPKSIFTNTIVFGIVRKKSKAVTQCKSEGKETEEQKQLYFLCTAT